MEQNNLVLLGTLQRGDRFKYLKGRAVYEVIKSRLASLEYVHTTTGEVFKVAALRKVKVSKNAYYAKIIKI